MIGMLQKISFFIGLSALFVMVAGYGAIGEDKTLLVAPATGAMLLSLFLFCISALRSRVFIPPAWGLFLVYAVYGSLMIACSSVPADSVQAMGRVWGAVGFYLVAANSIGSYRHARVLLGGMLCFLLVTAMYGLVVHFKAPTSVLWTERWAMYEGRLASTYICPNHYAHLLQMLLPFCLVLVFIQQSGVFLRILAGYCFLGFLPPLFFTESRAGWLGGIAAVGVTVCLAALRKSRRLFLVLVLVIPLMSAFLLLGAWNYSETFHRRMRPVVEFLQQQSADGIGNAPRDFRPQTWLDTIGMIKEKPWLGYGPGTYGTMFTGFRQHFKGVRVRAVHPHNEYLEIMADYGLVGFALFAAGWIYGSVRLLRFALTTEHGHHALMAIAFLGAVAGTMVHSFFDFQMHIYPNLIMFVLLAGLVASLMRQSQKSRPDPGKIKATAILGTSVALILVLWGGRVLGSECLRAVGDRAFAKGQSAAAERFHRTALSLDAGNWRALLGMGNILQDRRYHSIDSAEKRELVLEELGWFEQAYAENPVKDEVRLGLAKALIFSGQQEQGLQILRELADYRKFSDSVQWILGNELRKAGLYNEALEVFGRARKLADTPSINENIKWLQQRVAGPAGDGVVGPDQGRVEAESIRPPILKMEDVLDQMMRAEPSDNNHFDLQ
jgi:putative inorganic carbon (HCO3(-)) transporter